MTIARRLMVLVAVPLLILAGLGVVVRHELALIEKQNAFLAQFQITSLSTLGNISQRFMQMRVDARSYLLAESAAERARARASYDAEWRELNRLLGRYADTLVTGDRDRRLMDDFRSGSRELAASAERAMALRETQGREAASAMLTAGTTAQIAARLNRVLAEWIQHNEQLAAEAGKAAEDSIDSARKVLYIALGIALVLAAGLGIVTFRSHAAAEDDGVMTIDPATRMQADRLRVRAAEPIKDTPVWR